MSRQRKDPSGNPLPPRCYFKHSAYWYVYRNKWTRLGTSYASAMAAYGRQVQPTAGGFGALVDKALQAHSKLPTRGSKPPAANTMRNYWSAAKRVKSVFAEFEAEDIKASHIVQFHQHERMNGHPANVSLTVMKVVLSYALQWGMVEHNAAASVRLFADKRRTRHITDGELAAIKAHASPWLKVLIEILYLTGQRIGDVLKLKYSDISDEGIAFRQQKTGELLRVSLTPELTEAVAAARKLHGNVLSPYLFRPRGSGKPYSYHAAGDAWRKACKDAGVEDAHIHDLRAKSATETEKQGGDAQALLGHTSSQMTSRYLRNRGAGKIVHGPRKIGGK